MWQIIEPWFILHFDFSKLFVYYIDTICGYLEKVDISDYEWKIFLYFKLSKILYISTTIINDIRYINSIPAVNNNNNSNNNNSNNSNGSNNISKQKRHNTSIHNSAFNSTHTSSHNSYSNINHAKFQKNTSFSNNVRISLKNYQNSNQTQNLDIKNIDKSIFINIIILYPELNEIIKSSLIKSSQVSLNFIDDSIRSIEKAITLSLKFEQQKYLELYNFYIYIIKKEKPDLLNYLIKYNTPDRILKIKAIYTFIQSLNFSNNVPKEKLLEIEKQINALIASNNKLLKRNESKDSLLDDSETGDTSKSVITVISNNDSHLIYTRWNEQLLLIEFCQLTLKNKNFKITEKVIRTISKLKQLTFNQYAKYQLLLAEFVFNININKIDDILSERAIRLRVDFLNKLIKMINFYSKLGNSPNIIQEYIIKVWEYGIPLLQPQYKHYYYPFLKRCYEVLTQINSPLYSLYSTICKELAKYNDEISNINDAKLYIKNAYKYCFDKKKLEESFEYKNIELKLKASSMENTTFSKVEEALAMINQLNLKTKNIEKLKSSLYKILKILIPKHENHTFTSILPLMDYKFSINFELEDNNNVSQLKFFVEVLKLLLNIAYNIKYWELVYEITSYLICHDYSNFSEHETYFKIITADSLIKRIESLHYIITELKQKNNELKKDIKEVNTNIKNEENINTNTIIYLLLNQDLIKTEFDETSNENDEIEFIDSDEGETRKYKEKETDSKNNIKKKKDNDKKNQKKDVQETEEIPYINEIHEIHNIYGKQIPTYKNNNYLKKVLFNENDTFSSATGYLTLENLQIINDIYIIMEIGNVTNTSW